METLPWELIGQIGANLLPKWRCRLYICCRKWYHLLRQKMPLFDWCMRMNVLNKEVKNNIDYKIIKFYDWGRLHITSYLFIYGKRRVVCVYHKDSLYMTTSSGIGYIIKNCDIEEVSNNDTYVKMGDDAVELCSIDKSNSSIIHEYSEIIFKYLYPNEILKTVIALGIYYYYLYDNYGFFKRHRREYEKRHRRLHRIVKSKHDISAGFTVY
jgi:hypothetical protein